MVVETSLKSDNYQGYDSGGEKISSPESSNLKTDGAKIYGN